MSDPGSDLERKLRDICARVCGGGPYAGCEVCDAICAAARLGAVDGIGQAAALMDGRAEYYADGAADSRVAAAEIRALAASIAADAKEGG